MARPRKFSTAEAFLVLRRSIRKNGGFAPTVRQFQAELGVGSIRTAVRYLKLLEETKFIRRRRGQIVILVEHVNTRK
jgi:SOS-response transcriptional repressor LexA